MLRAVDGAWRWARDPEHRRRVETLARTPLFAGLRRTLLGRLAIRLFEKSYAAGEEIFAEGDPGHALFVVESGEVEVVRRSTAGGEEQLGVFSAGSSFGELALIDDQPRSATARAVSGTQLYILYRSHFEELVEGEPVVALALTRSLLRTLASYVRGLRREPGAGRRPGS